MPAGEFKVAIIDLYNNEANEGMRCIKEIVTEAGLNFDIYDTRYKNEVPELDYDIYISSGGPGSPFEGEGKSWEQKYFNLLDQITSFNSNSSDRKKYFFFICHSFQMMARYYKFAEVNRRQSKSFGIFPFDITSRGKVDILFKGLPNPLYAADFRQYQVVNPDEKIINELGAEILSVEHEQEGKDKALMAVRISEEIAGTQFHPEADPNSMIHHLKQDERKQHVIEKYNVKKYEEMLEIVKQPDKIILTRKTVLPNFINSAIDKLSLTLA